MSLFKRRYIKELLKPALVACAIFLLHNAIYTNSFRKKTPAVLEGHPPDVIELPFLSIFNHCTNSGFVNDV